VGFVIVFDCINAEIVSYRIKLPYLKWARTLGNSPEHYFQAVIAKIEVLELPQSCVPLMGALKTAGLFFE
jgi:hypothetical protein